jgi:hypothetical protein
VATVTAGRTTTDLVNSNWVAKTSTWQPAAHVTDANVGTEGDVSWDAEAADDVTLDIGEVWDVVPGVVVSVIRLVTDDGGKVEIMVVRELEMDVVKVVVDPDNVCMIVLIEIWVKVLAGNVWVSEIVSVAEIV